MSPSRRRAIGAVRGLASRPVAAAPLPAVAHRHGAWFGIPHHRRTFRLAPFHSRGSGCNPGRCPPFAFTALSEPRGLASRKIRTRITHGHGAMRRDGDIAPYRHYTRVGCAAIYPRALPGCRGARLGIVHTLRVLHAAALSAARCAAGPRTRRDVMIAPPLRTATGHAHCPRWLTAVPRRLSAVKPRLCPWRLPTLPRPTAAPRRRQNAAAGRKRCESRYDCFAFCIASAFR